MWKPHSVISDIISRFPRANLVLCGDFNFPDINWDNCVASARASKDFLEVVFTYSLSQVVTTPTRGSNILDLVLTTDSEQINSLQCVQGVSDHNILFFNIAIELPDRQPSTKYIRDYNKANFSEINNQLESFFEDFKRSASLRTVEQNWILYKGKLLSLIDAYVPLVRIRGDAGRPWYTNNLRILSRKKKRIFRELKRSNNPQKWDRYFTVLREYTGLLRHSKRKYFHVDLLSILRDNPRKFWNSLSPKRTSCHSIALINSDGSSVPGDECPDVMNSYFCSVFTNEPFANIPTLPSCNFSSMSEVIITTQGIANLIDNLKLSSAPGPDDITAKALKGTKSQSSRFLQLIFTQSVASSTIPNDWKISHVVPIHKSGSRSTPCNYRPISLTCIPCKLLEHILYSSIASHLDKHSFFFTKQHGFRQGYSCETQLFEFTTDLHLNLDSRFQTDVIYLDFSKAFDRVAHRRLISKLACLNLDTHVLSWIECFLTNRSQHTVIDNIQSSSSSVLSGVPQGSVLGPLLFLIFINDIPANISSSIRLFADDCVLYRRISSTNDQLILQEDLNKIVNWCSVWLMSLNVSKCKFMCVTRKHTTLNYQYFLKSSALTQVDCYRYLGVTITDQLTWTAHITNLVKDCSKSLGLLKRSLFLSPFPVRKLAYETFIRTKLEYASAIWNPHQNYLIDSLEAVQNRAVRFIASNYDWHTSITSIKSSLSIPNLSLRRKISQLSLFHKLYYNFPHLRDTIFLPPNRTSHRLFNNLSVQRLHGTTQAFNKSFLPTAIELWNALPEQIVHEQDSNKFRHILSCFLNP
uniref:Endonuclease/reverse transcriptase n=1 Tax=Rhipicephalus appendiculatus TaxID=34631 RepID=A0A131YPE6_RHIAP